MEGPIAPKPTTYNNIQFRSRLEARWAVCLDWYPFVNHWLYEPGKYVYDLTKFGGNYWLPDFYFATGYLKGLLEVKPSWPTNDYLTMLADASKHLEVDVYLGTDDFYNGVPRIQKIDPLHPHKDTRVPLTDSPIFPRISQAVQLAAYYRFDLADRPTPPFRQPVRGEYEHHLSRWAAEERRRTRRRS